MLNAHACILLSWPTSFFSVLGNDFACLRIDAYHLDEVKVGECYLKYNVLTSSVSDSAVKSTKASKANVCSRFCRGSFYSSMSLEPNTLHESSHILQSSSLLWFVANESDQSCLLEATRRSPAVRLFAD